MAADYLTDVLGRVAGLRNDLAATDAQLLDRFVAGRDEAAFAALVVRHGPMVWGVCRRLLHRPQDAEDAFQATFLVLARKADSVRKPDLLGNYLYGVAHRVAARARAGAARRHAREGQAIDTEAVAGQAPADPDLVAAVHEEVSHLPAKYRGPVVLCYLEGRTHEEAARALRWPLGTIKGRLARARELLRKRLLRRGLAPTAGVLAATLAPEALALPAPPALLDSTIRAATLFAANPAAAAGAISPQAVALTEGVLHTMFVTKIKFLAALLLALAVFAGGTGALAYRALAAADKKDKGDQEKIQGTWKVVSAKMDGKDPPGDEGEQTKDVVVEITADKVTVKFAAGDRVSSYKLDPAATPKQIDITYQGEGGENGKTTPGIYELKGDTLKICGPLPGNTERPTELASKPGGKTMLLVLKRQPGKK